MIILGLKKEKKKEIEKESEKKIKEKHKIDQINRET